MQTSTFLIAEMMPWIPPPPCSTVYTDWTAIALLLFTAVPLLMVVATATLLRDPATSKSSA